MNKQSEAIADAITTWPEVIYLVNGCDETPNYKEVMRSGEVTWCVDKQADGDVQYVSAEMYEKLQAKLAAAEARNADLEVATFDLFEMQRGMLAVTRLMKDNEWADHISPNAEVQELADEISRLMAQSEARTLKAVEAMQWQPIETAPQDGRTMLLGATNSHGNWRTMRGQWFSAEVIADEWEDPEDAEAGWYETAVEPDVPNCWSIDPTHWMPLPKAPE